MQTITLTLNPAFDVHLDAPGFLPFHENLAAIRSREAGGKGINLARALTANGAEGTALVVLGEENAADFRRLLAADGLSLIEIMIPGRIRENMTLHTEGSPETRISFKGFSADDSLLCRVERALEALVDGETILTLTGRLPEGIRVAEACAMLSRFAKRGVKIVLDSRSFGVADILALRPWLIKPNEEEIAAYLGYSVTRANASEAARFFQNAGISNSLISLGAEGAVLACEDGVFAAKPPHIHAVSTIGAGDSMIAGFLFAAMRGESTIECLRHAVAYGSAACLREGTRPPLGADIARILPEVICEKIG